ncbi:MAG: HAD family hydrolase [Verrucomicrobia bacterium]|nr:HAD family hydrolase [Verrucomicrobiota bacterium]
MRIRAAIIDIYGTLLDSDSTISQNAAHWAEFWKDHLHATPRITPEQFSTECDRVIAKMHALAQARGIKYPEVYWPHVVAEVLPEFSSLGEPQLSELRYYYKPMPRDPPLAMGAANALRVLTGAGVFLGIASNCQPYSLRELDAALAHEGLSRKVFQPDLCFFSFEHGFSKPDPYVFQILAARLAPRGIYPRDAVMIGDRIDSDIEPAMAAGWQTWHLRKTMDGDWTALRNWLDRHCRVIS